MNEPKRKRPKLKPLKLSDDDLDRMALITDQDVLNAGAEWKEHADSDELLESSPQIEEDNANSS